MNTNKLKVGSIFICSWGYEQTNIDYYQVTKVNPSGKTISIRQIASNDSHTGNMSGTSIPIPNAFTDSFAKTKKLNTYTDHTGNASYSIRINSFASAYLLTDLTKPNFFSYWH